MRSNRETLSRSASDPREFIGLVLAIVRVFAVLAVMLGVILAVLILDGHAWRGRWIGVLVYLSLVVGVPRILYIWLRRRARWDDVRTALLAYSLSLILQVPFIPALVLGSVFGV